MSDLKVESFLYRIEESLRRMESLDTKIEINMKKLNNLALELRGLATIVRPSVKKNEWYGEEIEGEVVEHKEIQALTYKK